MRKDSFQEDSDSPIADELDSQSLVEADFQDNMPKSAV